MVTDAVASPSAAVVSLQDVQESLGLFAQAVAGHPFSIEAVAEGEECWPWRRSGSQSRRLALPAQLDIFDSAEANRRAYRCIVLHQLLGESADPLADAAGHRLLRTIYEIVEDLRVDAVTVRRFPGAADSLRRVTRHARHHLDAPHDALGLLRLRSLGDLAGRPGGATLPTRVAKRIVREAEKVERKGATSADSLDAAVVICELLASTEPFDARDGSDSVPDVAAPPGIEPDGSGASLDTTGTPAQLERSASVVGGQPGSETASEIVSPAADEQEPHRFGVTLDLDAARHETEQPVRTFVYDEWDYHLRRHRPGWCRVVEQPVVGDDHGYIGGVRSRYADLRSDIRRRFARLRPDDLVRVHRCDDGDELDLDAAIEAIADRRGGAPLHDRVHVRRDRAARDVSAAFLLDLSASTSSPVDPEPVVPHPPIDPADDLISYAPLYDTPPSGRESPRRVIDVAKDAVALMSDALHELGDQHAVYGFSGSGRLNVDFVVAKEFADRVSGHTWAAVAAMEPRQYTRMGPAIRHATAKIRRQSSRTKLLIVISDGYPQDTDYGDDRADKDYGMHDTARALADAADAGIDTFCVTIDPAGHDYLRHMCADNRYLVIDDVEALPAALAKIYLALSTR